MDRLTFLLLLLWVGVTVSTEVELQKRMWGRKTCEDDERLYHVGLSDSTTAAYIHCGGSLIKPQWVLTAAHCKDKAIYAFVGVHPSTVVYPGSFVPMVIQEKLPHPDHDIVLLKLPSPVPPAVAKPMLLPDDNECKTPPQKGKDVRVAGHGRLDENGYPTMSPPTDLQCATMQVLDCNEIETEKCRPDHPDENWICYEGNNKGTTKYDSGGAVEYEGKIRAVHVAGGKSDCTGVGFSLDVCKFKQWIEDKTK